MNEFEKIRSALREGNSSSAMLRQALAEIDLAALGGVVAAAADRRSALLLDGSNKQIDVADAALAGATRELDRMTALDAALRDRIAEVARAEAAAVFDAEIAEVRAEAGEMVEILRDRFPALQSEMTAIFERLQTVEARAREMDRRLATAGRPERIGLVEAAAFPVPAGHLERAHSILRNIVKPVPGAAGWPTHLPNHIRGDL